MGKIKLYKKINDWKNLDEFFEKEVTGIKFSSADKFSRTFCRCGKVYSERKEICECGNTNFENIEEKNHHLFKSCKEKVIKEINGADYILKVQELFLNIYERQTIDFEIKETVALFIRDIKLIEVSDNHLLFISEEHLKDYKYYNELKQYNEIVNDTSYFFEGRHIYRVLLFLNKFPKLYLDNTIWQYKYLAKELFNTLKVSKTEKVSNFTFTDVLEQHDLMYPEYLTILNNYAKEGKRLKAKYKLYKGEKYNYYATEVLIDRLKELDKKYNDKDSLWQFIKGYLNNGTLTVYSGITLIDSYEDLTDSSPEFNRTDGMWGAGNNKKVILDKFNLDWLKYIKFYLRENLTHANKTYYKTMETGYHYVFLLEFIMEVLVLNNLGIEINEENLKQKKLNLVFTKYQLIKDTKIPNEKVDLFYDIFEKNPLKSLELLKDRRQLTKKQKEELLKEV